jgi:hypothetical protein
MRNRSLVEMLVFVSLLFTSSLGVRSCPDAHVRVRGCFGTVWAMFGLCLGYGFLAILRYALKNNTAV